MAKPMFQVFEQDRVVVVYPEAGDRTERLLLAQNLSADPKYRDFTVKLVDTTGSMVESFRNGDLAPAWYPIMGEDGDDPDLDVR